MKEIGTFEFESDLQLELVLRALNNALRKTGGGIEAVGFDAAQRWCKENCPCEKCTAARLHEK